MSKFDDNALQQVETALGIVQGEANVCDIIPRKSLRGWMRHKNIEVLGAVFALIHNPKHYSRIVPNLTFDDYHRFHQIYYRRCIAEDPDGEWADTRYTAAWSFVAWFKGIWRDKSTPRSALVQLREWLEELFENGNEQVRECLVTAVFEHLFEDENIRRFFSGWQNNPSMANAYRLAVKYADELRNGSAKS